MAFDLYFVGIGGLDWGATKFLYSQYGHRGSIKRIVTASRLQHCPIKMFVDSGAWTAFTKGIQIDIDEYITYLNRNSSTFSIMASLDVLPGGSKEASLCAEKSWDNYLYMRQHIIEKNKLIPVYHQEEPISNLIRMLSYEDKFGNIEYIGFGALASTLDYSVRDSFLAKCFEVVDKYRPNIKVHAFGMTDLRLLEEYPFASADSSTYALAGAMGEILTEFGRVAISLERKDRIRKESIAGEQVEKYVNKLGFDFDALAMSSLERKKYNIKYLQNWEANRVCTYGKKKIRRLF